MTSTLSKPKRMSVLRDPSCASSRTITPYLDRFGSSRHSRSKVPSVMLLMRVSLDEQSSNRTVYPTKVPILTPISWATRLATDTAATLRGCVIATPILESGINVAEARCRICEICVVLPDPVSPITTVVGLVRTAWRISSA